MDPLYEWSTANQMGLPLLQRALPLSFSRFLHVFHPSLRRLLLHERLRIRCAARFSNQEILVTLSSRNLGNSTDIYISGKIDDAWRKQEIIHNFCLRNHRYTQY